MKNFDWTKFTKRIAVRASLETIYNAWAKSSEIEKWFLSTSNYFNEHKQLISKASSIQKGYTYEWSWFLYDVTEKGNFTEANGKDYLQFTFADVCLVDIKLTKEGDYTIVELTQSNIPSDEESKQNFRLGCDSGWSFFLVNLKSIYEGGIDLRDKDERFKNRGIVNS